MTRLTFPRRRIRSIRPGIDPLESISPVSVLIPGLAPTSPALAAEIDAMPSRSRREMEWVGARDHSLAWNASVSTPIRSVPASFVPTSRTTLVMSGPAPGPGFEDVALVGAGASLAGTDGPGARPSTDAAGLSRPLFDGSGASGAISDPIRGARGLSPSHPNLAAADDDGIRPMSLPPFSILDPNGGGGTMGDSGGSGGDGGGDNSGGSGGSGGSGVDVKVFISGGAGSGGSINGLHPGEAGPPPFVIQGMQWNGILILQGADEGDYQIVNYTWSFPPDVLKGYGTFTTQYENDDPARSWVQFTGSPTSLSGNEVKADFNFSQDDLNSDAFEAGDHVINTFYWGPTATGSSQVSVTATVRNIHTNSTISGLTDSVEFNVLKPTGSMSLLSIGVPGVTPPQEFGPQYLSMAQDTPRGGDGHASGLPLGIRYSSTVTVPGGFGGVFMHNQTMTTTEQRTYQDATGVHHEARGKYNGQPYDLSSNFVLDATVGYLGRVDDPNVGSQATSENVSSAPVGHTFYSNDSPASPLTPPNNSMGIDWFRVDNFHINLMYNPLPVDPNKTPGGTPDSIWVPVGVLVWYWGAFAVFSNGIWVADPHPDHGPISGTGGDYQPSTIYPTWSVNIRDANGNNDRTVDPWTPLP